MSESFHSGARSLANPMLFSALEEGQREKLRHASSERSYSTGQIVQQRGAKADGFYVLESGSVSVGQFLPDGEFRAAALLGPGDSWGELAMFAGKPRVVDVIAREECRIRHIRSDLFKQLMSEHPDASMSLLGALSAQLQEMLDLLAGIRRGSARPRIAGVLANLAGASAGPVMISITQEELGDLLGLTRMTVNTELKQLEREGMIQRRYRKIEIINPEELRNISLVN